MAQNQQPKHYKSRYADERQKVVNEKFAENHFLHDERNMDNFILWTTFFRRNLHRVAIDYLGLTLHIYQILILYMMGISSFFVIIASRSAAKSFIIAVYSVCKCIMFPNSMIVLASATAGQSKLIVTEKIKNELMGKSKMLQREILGITANQSATIVNFRNGSTITCIPALDSKRGYRSTDIVREEFRQIEKNVDDSVLSPFQIVRQPPYITDPYYSSIKELLEESTDIYISSSWIDNGHWMWKIVDQAYDGMIEDKPSCLLAFDESIPLKHNIKTRSFMLSEKKKQDPLTWRLEFLNERVKEDSSAYFTHSLFTKNQTVQNAFYPRKHEDVRAKKKNIYDIPKQPGEVRIVSCDMAFIENKDNDNSIFSCMRGFPEYRTYSSQNGEVAQVRGYKRVVSYMESIQGGDTFKQARRIRQLYEDFHADYIVLDARNAGRNAVCKGNFAYY